MKRKPEPASVEDCALDSDETVSGSRRTASRPFHSTPFAPYKRTKRAVTDHSRTKGASSKLIATSINRGPILDALKKYEGDLPWTILSGSDDRSVERNAAPGMHLRKFFYKDHVINKESSTYIERELFMSSEDAANLHPHILIEQRTYDEHGREVTLAHQLFFGERLVPQKVYIFKECGDEIRGIGKPDLHFTAQVLSPEKWAKYIKEAKYFGYDEFVDVKVSREDMKKGRVVTYPFQESNKSSAFQGCSGISIAGNELLELSNCWANGSRSCKSPEPFVFTVKLLGLGAMSEDKLMRGDVNVKIRVEA